MSIRFSFVLYSVVVAVLSTQSTGSITGLILYPDGSRVPHAPIQVKGKATGAIAQTFSKNDGSFDIPNLAAGAYDFTIAMPCCAYARFNQEVMIEPGKAAHFNASLTETLNGATIGDDPARNADAMLKRANVPQKAAPRTGTGVPDLSGVWLLRDDPYPESPELLPEMRARLTELAKDPRNAPHSRCLPGPPPIPGASSPFIGKIVQTPSLLVVLFEDYPGFRQIFIDGRKHPDPWTPSWMGHSAGRWEKDTLVVDTVGFNDMSLLGGIGGGPFPHTEALHMTERYRRINYGTMELKVTFEDPQAFAKPYHENLTLLLAPQEELLEFVCENNKPEHLVPNK